MNIWYPLRFGRIRLLAERRLIVVLLPLLTMLVAVPASAEGPAHPDIPELNQLIADFDAGILTLEQLRALGLSVFATPFNLHDGLGDGSYDPNETNRLAFGHRPSLQGNGQHLRVNGLDAQSCNECHTIVSNRSRVPTLGLGGVGGVVQNAIIMPSMIDVSDSSDDRVLYKDGHNPDLKMVADGIADFNGRFANPPFLFGGGGVELVAKEMTEDLQKILETARTAPAGTVLPLNTHGVSFGTVTSQGGGNVDLDVEGIGPEDITNRRPEEVLVVRPFGRKGENFSMRDFDRGAMQFHFGIQPVEVVGEGNDEDGDGVSNEATVAEMSVLHIFDVTNPRPILEPLGRDGRAGERIFDQIGCGGCHIPSIHTRGRNLPLAFPENGQKPRDNVYLEINLVKAGFQPATGGGVEVPMFSDLKRHAMGPGLAETFEHGEIANDEFITARLWGIADTAPYLHDGRATTLSEAIKLHGGEAQAARDAFMALGERNRENLLTFLGKLRTPNAPNQELLELLK
ncbi:MAG: hypothetical protein OEY80_08460 [Nitrospirota bacterium]|nr:hypothetical protein [Nitrospirota bacterium]